MEQDKSTDAIYYIVASVDLSLCLARAGDLFYIWLVNGARAGEKITPLLGSQEYTSHTVHSVNRDSDTFRYPVH